MADFAPIYSTHGHARKTHLSIDAGPALCGESERSPERMWTMGDSVSMTAGAVADYLDPDTQDACCRRCKKLLRAQVAKVVADA